MAASAGELFEPASPLALRLEAATQTPISAGEMVERARSILGSLSEEEKIRTLNAHPRIGERPDGMSAHSRAEQAAGGDGSGELADELREMNAEYERRFGFRFVVFVNRRPRRELLAELRERMGHSREQELQAGLDAIMDIASDRLRS